jgi:hypothetical protein
MAREMRTRILILLPFPKTMPDFFTVLDVLEDLERTSGGVTRTDYFMPEVWGQWFDDTRGAHVEDDLVFIISDDAAPLRDPHLESDLTQMKLDLQAAFDQDIVWITMHEVTRIAAHDYVK